VTGEHSRFQISRLAAKYIELKEDGRFLSNRHSMAIIRQRVQQLAERIDLNEAPDRLERIMKLWREYREVGGGSGDGPDAIKIRFQLEAAFESAFHDYAAWQQMFDALELDRKMVESEVKIAKDLKAILTAEDAYELAAKLLGSIIEAAGSIIIDDTIRGRLLKRIEYEFAKLIGDRSSREVDPGFGGSGREIIDSVASSVD
jgi:phage shock protein A